MSEQVIIGNATLYQGDALEILPTLGQADAVITDPPYGKVRGDFDNAWTNRPAMLADVDRWLDAIVPRLRFNGTLWWFAWPSLAGRIEARIADRLNPLAHIVWQKPAPTSQKCRKEALRAPMPGTERILMAEHYGADNAALGESGYAQKCDEARGFVFEPLRAYLADEMAAAGHSLASVNKAWQAWKGGNGGMSSHWFTSSQWALPTATNYQWLRDLFNANCGNHMRREYEDLRREYEDLRRYFNCESGDQFSDIWQFSPCHDHLFFNHPTRKPIPLMRHIIKLSVRPGGTIIDPFMGSASTGVAAVQMGRSFIGIELDPRYFDIACHRIEDTQRQEDMFVPAMRPSITRQAPLFEAA